MPTNESTTRARIFVADDVSEKGLQAVIDFIRQRNPQVPNLKPQEFMDNRFIKELDESGFIKSLYAKPS